MPHLPSLIGSSKLSLPKPLFFRDFDGQVTILNRSWLGALSKLLRNPEHEDEGPGSINHPPRSNLGLSNGRSTFVFTYLRSCPPFHRWLCTALLSRTTTYSLLFLNSSQPKMLLPTLNGKSLSIGVYLLSSVIPASAWNYVAHDLIQSCKYKTLLWITFDKDQPSIPREMSKQS